MTDESTLLSFRPRFPILGRSTYLVSHSLGAMPEAVGGAMAEYVEVWATRGVRAWADAWWTMSMETGDLIAPIVGAPARSIVMLPNVTTAEAVVLSAFDYSGARNRVVMVEGEFPSVRYVHSGLARRLGAEIVTIPPDASGLGFDLERLLEAIDERTALVPLSHVLFQSAWLVDAEAVARRCREVGATLVLDVFQSAGIVPVELRRWDVPIAVGGVLKWLCGGPGGGWLYVEPELRERLQPALTGWMAHPEPFAFEPPPMRWRDDALRFGLGTPPIPSIYAARAGVQTVLEASAGSIEPIRRKSLRQTGLIMAEAERRGFEVRTPLEESRRGGTVSVGCPNAREVAAELNARDVVCDYRPLSGIRLSPHLYTTDEEIRGAFGTIDEILETEAWRRHGERRTLVT